MKKNFFKLGVLMMMAFPLITFAQNTKTLRDVIYTVIQYFQVFITLIIGLAILTFIWNIYNYFFKKDVEDKKNAGLYVLYSTIGFFIILSFWGIVALLSNSLNLPSSQPMWPFGIGGTNAPNSGLFTGGLNTNNVSNGGLNTNSVSNGGLNTNNVSSPQSYDEAIWANQGPRDYNEAVGNQ